MIFDEIVEDCFQKLPYKDRQYLKDHPDPLSYHFSYGMYIRNHYIHENLCDDFICDADGYSQKVIEAIILRLIPGLDLSDDFTSNFLTEPDFKHVWIRYKKVFDEYPIAILDKYKAKTKEEMLK